MPEAVIVHYDEIALKAGRRAYYEERLTHAIQNACRDLGIVAVERLRGRMIVRPGRSGAPLEVILDRLSRVFGIRYLLRALEVEPTLPAMNDALLALARGRPEARSFGVRARRLDDALPLGSTELSAALGAGIQQATGWRVDLARPDVWFRVEAMPRRAFVAAERIEGPGGLPIGTTGHGVALVSGGIDSPVAAWMMMGRGVRISAVHFHSAPYTSRESQDKVRDLLGVLARFQPTIDAAFVPFAATVQQHIIERAPQRFRVLLYRRFMVRIAQALAHAAGASCLVTGDSLGQVASQTIENIAAVDACAALPVFRPLIGTSKSEITATAQLLGTYEISIRGDEDCCAYLLPRRPATTSTPAMLAEAEAALPIDEMVAAAVAAAETFTVRFEAPVAP